MIEQLSLFPDLVIEPTPAMRRGASVLVSCKHCGTLVCVPSTIREPDKPRTLARALGPCPSCPATLWNLRELGEGPFKPANTAPAPAPTEVPANRRYISLDTPVTCPHCESTWTTLTPVSWWRFYDRCYSCMADATDTPGRCLTVTEMAPFTLPTDYTWRCCNCTWHTRASGRIAHEQVRTHLAVTRHSLAPAVHRLLDVGASTR